MRKSTLPFFVTRFADTAESGGSGEDQDTENKVESGEAEEDTETQDDSGDDTGDESEAADDDDEEEGADQLGDAGKQALDRMKARLKAERKRRQDLEAKYEPTDDGAADIMKKAHDKILRSEVKAAAKGQLADPSDAYRFLDLEQFEVSEDGDVDEDEIAEAIKTLIEEKPYLAAQTQGERRFKGGGGNGVRKDSRPHQLTEQDVDRMSLDQINKARREGRLNDLLGISR